MPPGRRGGKPAFTARRCSTWAARPWRRPGPGAPAPSGGPWHDDEPRQLESCYFSDSRDLTLCITGASWLDKDKTSFTLDLRTGKAGWLPEGMVIESVERSGDNVHWALQPGDGVSLHWSYCDPEGGEHEWGGYSMSATGGDGWCERSTEYRTLLDYPWDTVTVVLSSNRSTEFAQPIQIPIK